MAAGEGGTVPDKPTRTSVSIIVRTDNFSNLKAFMLEPNCLKKYFVELKTVRSEADERICLLILLHYDQVFGNEASTDDSR
jgi:hypothetical protein